MLAERQYLVASGGIEFEGPEEDRVIDWRGEKTSQSWIGGEMVGYE